MALAQALLVRALVARLADDPYAAPLVRWGTRLHDRFLLPHFAAADLAEVVADLRSHGYDLDLAWFDPHLEFRFPLIGDVQIGDVALELRSAIEPWPVLGLEVRTDRSGRDADSSTERLQLRVDGLEPRRHLVTVNGQAVPLTATPTPGRFVAGVRYQARTSPSSLHPTLKVDAPLTVDLVDLPSAVSLGGATYHASLPGGLSYHRPPINAREAEARRARRFEPSAHTAAHIDVEDLTAQLSWRAAGGSEFPLTLDLRRGVPKQWGRR
jgi:uncharacterized protein (DUF2126 family)